MSEFILLPPGRVVQGDLYEPQKTDKAGNPLTVKTGPNKGQPRVNYFFSIAIPKTAGCAHWSQEAWGAQIYNWAWQWWGGRFASIGTFPKKFAFKVDDGDDAEPNEDANMKRNCDRPGFPGNWIVSLGSGYATKIVDRDGAPLTQPGFVKRGYWVEVYAAINSNENDDNPGIYINHQFVSFAGYDKEITGGPDAKAVLAAAQRGALPSHVSQTPLPGANVPSAAGAPPAANGSANAAPPPPALNRTTAGASNPPPPPVPGMGASPPPPTTRVTPHTGYMNPAGAGAPAASAGLPPAPGALPPPPGATTALPPPPPAASDPLGAPPGFRMTQHRYADLKAGGWTDEQMLAGNQMVRL